MSEDLLDVPPTAGREAPPQIEGPAKFRDPATGAVRIEALVKS